MSIPAWARKGAKVVCISNAPEPGKVFYNECPPLGEPVTISGHVYALNGWALVIAEYPNPDIVVGEVGWLARRFRPLISQADDIATHFQALLSAPVKTEEPA